MIKQIKEHFLSRFKYKRTPDDLLLFVFSDLHWLSKKEWEIIRNIGRQHPDAVLMLGDIDRNTASAIVEAVDGTVPILSVLGNHDEKNQFDNIPDIINLDKRAYKIKNTVFAGISGSIRYKNDDSLCMRMQEEIEEIAKNLPKADVLLSHDGPYHLMQTNKNHEGLKGVTWYIKNQKPSLSLFGHQHFEYDGMVDKTKCLCIFRFAIISTKDGTMQTIF